MYRVDKLKQIRKQNNITIYEMADKLSITASYYSQLENKKRKLYYDQAFKIASVFDLKPDDLFFLEE